MDLRLFTALALALSGAAACGGGGGGGGGGSSGGGAGGGGGGGGIPDYVSFDVTTAVATNVEGGISNGAFVTATLSQEGQNQFSSGDTIYIVITPNSSVITSIDVLVIGAQGDAQINVDNSLPVGSYTASLNVRVCKDSGCSNVVSNSNLPFRYDVLEPAIDVSDALELGFVQYQDQGLPSDSTTYDFSSFSNLIGSPDIYLNLDVDEQRGDSDERSSWVDLLIDGSSGTITATALTSDMPCGRTDGHVVVHYRTLEWEHRARVPIEYTIGSLPVVHAVHPRVIYDGQPADVIVTGCGFESINAMDLRINGTAPLAATIVSNREMNVTLPPGLADGYHDISFESSTAPAGSPTQQLLVKQRGARPDLDFNLMAQGNARYLRTVWDEERERLFVADTNSLALFQNTGTEWQYSQVSGVASSNGDHLLLSADGKHLIRLSSGGTIGQGLALYNAVTYELEELGTLQETRLQPSAIDKFNELYMSPGDVRPSNYAVFTIRGSLLREARAIRGSLANRSVLLASGNRDVLLISALAENGWIRIDTTDMSEQFQSHTAGFGSGRDGWVSSTGAYAEISDNQLGTDAAIFDADFAFVGRLPATTVLADQTQAIRTPGVWIDETTNTAIASFSEETQSGVPATQVRYELYDLTSTTNDPFVAIDSVELTGLFNPGVDDKEENYFFVSADGETVFRTGDRISIMQNPFQ